jgi:HTH-type transcriptional regulator, cell division transcriptional repressor
MKKSKNTQIDDHPKSSHIARANRVKSLRQMTRLSRRLFAETYGIPASTLQNWEDIGANGLSEKGAIKLARVLKTVGIHCSIEWLLYGIGESPIISDQLFLDQVSLKHQSLVLSDDEEVALIAAELLLFRQHYKQQVMDFIIQDDGMLPRFVIGEYVAGVSSVKQLDKMIGYDCIIQAETGEMFVRNVKLGSIPGRYTLVCANPQTTVPLPALYDVEVIAMAPIIWARRPEGRCH